MTSNTPTVPLDEYARLERDLLDVIRMFAAVVWSMPDKRATLWPPQIEAAPDLLLTRYDNPTDKSIVFTADTA